MACIYRPPRRTIFRQMPVIRARPVRRTFVKIVSDSTTDEFFFRGSRLLMSNDIRNGRDRIMKRSAKMKPRVHSIDSAGLELSVSPVSGIKTGFPEPALPGFKTKFKHGWVKRYIPRSRCCHLTFYQKVKNSSSYHFSD